MQKPNYENGDIDDAYCIQYPNNEKHDNLYIKFALINQCVIVELASFRLS